MKIMSVGVGDGSSMKGCDMTGKHMEMMQGQCGGSSWVRTAQQYPAAFGGVALMIYVRQHTENPGHPVLA